MRLVLRRSGTVACTSIAIEAERSRDPRRKDFAHNANEKLLPTSVVVDKFLPVITWRCPCVLVGCRRASNASFRHVINGDKRNSTYDCFATNISSSRDTSRRAPTFNNTAPTMPTDDDHSLPRTTSLRLFARSLVRPSNIEHRTSNIERRTSFVPSFVVVVVPSFRRSFRRSFLPSFVCLFVGLLVRSFVRSMVAVLVVVGSGV